MSTSVLVIAAASRASRRELGAQAWCVLEELVLGAENDGEGLVAAVGVREIAGRLGITKDTAARAMSALAGVGIVVRDRVEVADGRARSGYRLVPPNGMLLARCPCAEDAGLGLCDRVRWCPGDREADRCQTARDNSCQVAQDGSLYPIRASRASRTVKPVRATRTTSGVRTHQTSITVRQSETASSVRTSRTKQ